MEELTQKGTPEILKPESNGTKSDSENQQTQTRVSLKRHLQGYQDPDYDAIPVPDPKKPKLNEQGKLHGNV